MTLQLISVLNAARVYFQCMTEKPQIRPCCLLEQIRGTRRLRASMHGGVGEAVKCPRTGHQSVKALPYRDASFRLSLENS